MKAATVLGLLALGYALLCPSPGAGNAREIRMEVDAREISHGLLHVRLEIPASPGELILWYPKWIPQGARAGRSRAESGSVAL